MSTLQQQHGQILEKYIRMECKALAKAKKAFVDKNWEAPRVPGKKIPREASKPDFSGFLNISMSRGKHVVFEAKATMSKTSFPFSQITLGQAEHLDAAAISEAVAFVYILDGNRQKWVVPWWVIDRIKKSGVASFNFDSYPELKKQKGETWLDILIRIKEVGHG